jgi:hypothetical protein
MYLKEFGCNWVYGSDCCNDFEKKEWEVIIDDIHKAPSPFTLF